MSQGWTRKFSQEDQYTERRSVRTDVLNTFIEASEAYLAANTEVEKQWEVFDKAKSELEMDVKAAARWNVRYEHLDWFNPNGTRRGAFRKEIDEAVNQASHDLWEEAIAPLGLKSTRFLAAFEFYNPFPESEVNQKIRHTMEYELETLLRVGKHRVDSEDKLPHPDPEKETDLARREKYIAVRERWLELRTDPETEAAKERVRAAAAALRRATPPIRPDTPEYVEFDAAKNDPAYKLWLEVERAFGTIERQMTVEVVCSECHTVSRGHWDVASLSSYVCYECKETKRRHKRLQASRDARQSAQQSAQRAAKKNAAQEPENG